MLKKVLGYGLLLIVVVSVGGFAYLYFRKPAMAPPASIRVELTPARLARGKYLFHTICDCVGCHAGRDFTRFGGPVIEGTIGQGFVFPPELGLPGTLVAPNITPDKETGMGNWTDGEKIRAIREGISRDGSVLFPMMPYPYFKQMSDEDVYSIVAYMNALPPIKNRLARSSIKFPVSMFIKSVPQPAGKVPEPDRSTPAKYGEYLATLGGCAECHTPAEKGQIIRSKLFSGGQEFNVGVGVVVSANITPDLDTGIGIWSEQTFLDKFYQYKRYHDEGPPKIGPESFTLMPWLSYCQLPPEDLKALFAFLKLQVPIYHAVETHPLHKIAPGKPAT